eukprot:CAMPEP_0171830312 /NCGR_PEP_ID=MMETSP0992-20121227/8165_1 /TAXON_ID=483369 /ORGANISM="non described non described, Strain CCMP2098" /LENGTH=642 /DNA_ID=CAMNT_0012445625 /DNA_START=17 /DNA_END=1945 /DNA_ORIENTATION=+
MTGAEHDSADANEADAVKPNKGPGKPSKPGDGGGKGNKGGGGAGKGGGKGKIRAPTEAAAAPPPVVDAAASPAGGGGGKGQKGGGGVGKGGGKGKVGKSPGSKGCKAPGKPKFTATPAAHQAAHGAERVGGEVGEDADALVAQEQVALGGANPYVLDPALSPEAVLNRDASEERDGDTEEGQDGVAELKGFGDGNPRLRPSALKDAMPDIDQVKQRFRDMSAHESGGTDLDKGLFKKLVQEFFNEEEASEQDLDVAFQVADADKNGTVDVNEFVKLYLLVQNGEVKGLAATNYKQREAFRKRANKAESEVDEFDDAVSQLTDDQDAATMLGGTLEKHEMMEDLDEDWNPTRWEVFKSTGGLRAMQSKVLMDITLLDRKARTFKHKFGLAWYELREVGGSDGLATKVARQELFKRCKKKVDQTLHRIRLKELRYGELCQLSALFDLRIAIRDEKRLLGSRIYSAMKKGEQERAQELFLKCEEAVTGKQKAIKEKQALVKHLVKAVKLKYKGRDTVTDITGDKPSGGWFGFLETKKELAREAAQRAKEEKKAALKKKVEDKRLEAEAKMNTATEGTDMPDPSALAESMGGGTLSAFSMDPSALNSIADGMDTTAMAKMGQMAGGVGPAAMAKMGQIAGGIRGNS